MKSIGVVRQKVSRERAEIVRVCQSLVRVPSENPPGDTTRIFDYVAGLLKRWRFSCTIERPAPKRQNLVASWDTGRPGKHLVLNAHLDTGAAGERRLWHRSPFSGDVATGRIYGLGTTDMKAGATASLFTLRLCREFEKSISGKVTLTLVCDEETFGEYGARHLLAHRPECLGDALLSGEPGPPGIIRIGDKGRVWSELRFRAPGGHAAMPYVSKNAIHEAIRFFAEIRGIERWKSPVPVSFGRYLTSVERTLDRELGKGATAAARRYIVGLGVITGGDAVNVIAPVCTIQVDARIPMGGQVATVVAALRKAARAHGGDLKLMSTVEPSLTSAAEPICRIVKQAVEGIGGKKAVFGMGLYSDDVRLWRYAGVPAVGYGPTPHNMLRPNEYVEIRDLLQTVMVHSATALAFLERPD